MKMSLLAICLSLFGLSLYGQSDEAELQKIIDSQPVIDKGVFLDSAF